MKVLWLCNIILPKVAAVMGLKASNKEGWLSGASAAAEKGGEFELGICFPVGKENDGFFFEDGVKYYGFYEDTSHPENYDPSLEDRLSSIVDKFDPDIVHIFGTEFPHTRAMAEVMKDRPEHILIGMQGIVAACADHYFDGLPERVINRVTFRDLVKKDSLKIQKDKFALRTENETAALKISGNVTGRTPFDREYTSKVNPEAKYHFMNETLRAEFYEHALAAGAERKDAEPHSVFLSQGNYPLKGAHMMIKAFAELKKKYPDANVTAVDYSELSVAKAREYNRDMITAGRCKVLQGDVSDLRLPEGKYDLATAFETIYFWPGLEKCFGQVAKVLKPGGYFLVCNESDGTDATGLKFEKIIDGMKCHTVEEIESALKNAGFSRVKSGRHKTKPWITVVAQK